MHQHLNRFYHIATQNHLAAAAILLWQMLYVYMARCGSFADFALATSVFQSELQLSRQGLLQARKSLEDAGLLRTELDADQHLRYTLCMDGRALQAAQKPAAAETGEPLSDAARAAMTEPLAQQPKRQEDHYKICAGIAPQHGETMQAVAEGHAPAAAAEAGTPFFPGAVYHRGDIILNGKYKGYLNTVEQRLGRKVRDAVHSWLNQRRDNGWTLTLWGLEELLQKLVRLAEGVASHMVDIVLQSIRRKWKGFFKLTVQSNPSGETLLQKERRAQQTGRQDRSYVKPYVTDDMDLSIFEE